MLVFYVLLMFLIRDFFYFAGIKLIGSFFFVMFLVVTMLDFQI